MGIAFSQLPFYDLCYRQGAIHSPTLALGSQELHESPEAIRAFAERYSHSNLARDAKVASLFRDRYQVPEYRDCDLNSQSDFQLDLNHPLPQEFEGKFATVVNAGTIEHVFDIAQAQENIHALLSEGGAVVHIVPVSWYDHGYYNLNPRFFSAIGKANEYRLVAEAFHFARTVTATGESQEPVLRITFDGQAFTEWHEKITIQLKGQMLPASVLYMVAYQKTHSMPFVVPYDIQD